MLYFLQDCIASKSGWQSTICSSVLDGMAYMNGFIWSLRHQFCNLVGTDLRCATKTVSSWWMLLVGVRIDVIVHLSG